MDKKQVQEALGRIDNALAQLTVNRQVHVALVGDVQLVQQCCMAYLDSIDAVKAAPEKKNGRTDIEPKCPKPGDKDK